MTRAEQAERRKAIIEAVDSGEKRSSVAQQFNVSRDTIDKACQGQGLLSLRLEYKELWVKCSVDRQLRALAKTRRHALARVVDDVIRVGLRQAREARRVGR